MFHSVLSRKRKLCLDTNVLNEVQGVSGDYTYSFNLDKHFFTILQSGDRYDLKIDNKSFNTLMIEDRNKSHDREVVSKKKE
jgi:hypothetical protein